MDPQGPRIIGAELADRYGRRSARVEALQGITRDPCFICGHPTGDCAHDVEFEARKATTPSTGESDGG